MTDEPKQASTPTLRVIDDEALALAGRLLRGSGHGTLAVLEAGTGHPLASRTSFACDPQGAPIILISGLAAHTPALRADPRCSLLAGEPGAGDPLAHPRITLIGRATRLERDSAAGVQARARFLDVHRKAALYADFPDFEFWRIAPLRASLNGGFGRAWLLSADDIRRAMAVDAASAPEARG